MSRGAQQQGGPRLQEGGAEQRALVPREGCNELSAESVVVASLPSGLARRLHFFSSPAAQMQCLPCFEVSPIYSSNHGV